MKAFVDTNILVYAYDSGSGVKHERALDLIKNLWAKKDGILSTQVVNDHTLSITAFIRFLSASSGIRPKAARAFSTMCAGLLVSVSTQVIAG